MYTVYIVAIRRGKYPLYITTTYFRDVSKYCLSFQGTPVTQAVHLATKK